jgi:hypothetical protein
LYEHIIQTNQYLTKRLILQLTNNPYLKLWRRLHQRRIFLLHLRKPIGNFIDIQSQVLQIGEHLLHIIPQPIITLHHFATIGLQPSHKPTILLTNLHFNVAGECLQFWHYAVVAGDGDLLFVLVEALVINPCEKRNYQFIIEQNRLQGEILQEGLYFEHTLQKLFALALGDGLGGAEVWEDVAGVEAGEGLA